MGKKRAGQQRIEGTYDEVPQDVQDKCDEYVKSLRLRQKHQKKEDSLRAELLELMKQHNVELVETPDLESEDKVLVLEHGKDKVKIKKKADLTEAA